MKNIMRSIVLLAVCFIITVPAFAEKSVMEKQSQSKSKKNLTKAPGDRCRRAQGASELNINNVRARINVGGNMWFDGSNARYVIPQSGNASSLYCSSLWIGGVDGNGQLRLAAMRFGQSGDDFWPGPLTIDGTAYVESSVCDEYDKHYKINRADVENYKAMLDNKGNFVGNIDDVAEIIKNWPGNGNTDKKQSKFLAPFFDRNGDGNYDWQDGDYPYYDFDNALCPKLIKAGLAPGVSYKPASTMESNDTLSYNVEFPENLIEGGILVDQVLKGDQTLWWIMNDKGNTHTESQGEPIGLEIRAQAFAFTTNDEINNMTFYSYEIINRSTYVLSQTYFSQWVDPDLGFAGDDYIGCDVERGLGYCYNGKAMDGPSVGAYVGNPPAVGIDFFQGPYMDPDGLDNPKIDIDKMSNSPEVSAKLKESVENGGYSIFVNGVFVAYDTIRLTDDAALFKDYWYFKKNDSVGNCAINGVNFGNLIVDDERFGMRRFVYYNNDASAQKNGEPYKAMDYYNYLRGYWKDGSRMTFGGPGFGIKPDVICDFMFPGTTDRWNWGTNGELPPEFYRNDPRGWTEESSKNTPGDRRFMQSAGPFTLKPGAVNYITVGIPWAQAPSGGPYASVDLLKQVDDKCQALFDNCFKLIDGPDAPSLTISPLANELVLYLTYDNPASNNYNERYNEIDYTIDEFYLETVTQGDTIIYVRDTTIAGNPVGPDTLYDVITKETPVPFDRNYRFEGYQIFQLKDKSVTINDVYDPEKAKLVAQCDVVNFDSVTGLPISKLINYQRDNNTGGLVGRVMVDGSNSGIRHSFVVKDDLFSSGSDKQLVNNKEYYFIAVAYAYNNYKPYSQTDANFLDGQKTPYLIGRKAELDKGQIRSVMAIPSDPSSKNGGTIIQTMYGDSPEITRIQGHGNGGMIIDLQQNEIDLLSSGNMSQLGQITYKRNFGPVNVRVVDPLQVKQGEFRIQFTGIDDSSKWVLTKVNGEPLYEGGPISITSDASIGTANEQLILQLGISISIEGTNSTATTGQYYPGYMRNGGSVLNGSVLGSSIHFTDSTKQWLGGVNDYDALSPLNWIRSGEVFASSAANQQFLDTENIPEANFLAYLTQDFFWMNKNKVGVDSIPTKMNAIDPLKQFESLIYRTWAPYKVTSFDDMHPGFTLKYYINPDLSTASVPWKVERSGLIQSENMSLMFNDLNNLASVRIVLTADKSKWSRCPVLEMSDNYNESEGNARKFQLRKSESVDKDGNPDNNENHPTGMGWFPGYAINLETGERLNIMFGEDSRFPEFNGQDMMWNPTSTLIQGSNYVFGGRHFIYILGSNEFLYKDLKNPFSATPARYNCPAYDEGEWAYRHLRSLDNLSLPNNLITTPVNGSAEKIIRDSAAMVFANVMWVNIPYVPDRFQIDNPSQIPSDVTINLNVRKSYKNGYNAHEGANINPIYQFNMDEKFSTLTNVAKNTQNKEQKDKMKSVLDNVKIIPNPYYSRSSYESDQLQTLVKIAGLTGGSEVTIYSVDGTLVRRLDRCPPTQNFLTWDLLNHKGQHIAGGMYLFHIKMPNIGETVVRWFGTMRPEDINSFPQ